MAFNSAPFFIFWFILYWFYLGFSQKPTIRTWVLLLANIWFFTFLSGYAVFVLIGSALIDFSLAKAIHKTKSDSQKSMWLFFSVILNVGLILFFKHIYDWFGLGEVGIFHFIGVSFYAFRSLGYVLDVYFENTDEPETNWVHYLTYASYFPLILSGPIAPSADFLSQLKKPIFISKNYLSKGTYLIALGVTKKFILGNYLAYNFVNRVFESWEFFTAMELFLASIIQTFYLYLDFSGYTDMVVGMSLLLGIDILENFNFPFLSQNITEYWKRWHISLSKWFNQNLYFPLSYQFRSLKKFCTSVAVFIVFMISGFWHGTSVNYWFWGMLHALALVWDIYTSDIRLKVKTWIPKPLYRFVSIVITFSFLVFSGVYFKASSFETANGILLKIGKELDFSLISEWIQLYPGVLIITLIIVIVQFTLGGVYSKLENRISNSHWLLNTLILVLIIFIAYQFEKSSPLPFYYLKY